MNMEFIEENDFNYSSTSPDEKGLIGWLIKKGIVKDRKNANILLISVIVICLLLIGYIIFKQNGTKNTEPVSAEELRWIPDDVREELNI